MHVYVKNKQPLAARVQPARSLVEIAKSVNEKLQR